MIFYKGISWSNQKRIFTIFFLFLIISSKLYFFTRATNKKIKNSIMSSPFLPPFPLLIARPIKKITLLFFATFRKLHRVTKPLIIGFILGPGFGKIWFPPSSLKGYIRWLNIAPWGLKFGCENIVCEKKWKKNNPEERLGISYRNSYLNVHNFVYMYMEQ